MKYPYEALEQIQDLSLGLLVSELIAFPLLKRSGEQVGTENGDYEEKAQAEPDPQVIVNNGNIVNS